MAAAFQSRVASPTRFIGSRLPRALSHWFLACLIFVGCGIAFVNVAEGQAPWEYSHYQVSVWLSADDADFPPQLRSQIADFIQRRAEAVHGAAWDVATSTSPPDFQSLMALDGPEVTPEELQFIPEDALTADKLFFVTATAEGDGYRIRARELDCRTRQLGPLFKRFASTRDDVALSVWDAIGRAFTPLTRIESVDGRTVTAQVRAGGLVTDPESPLLIRADDALRPIIRRNDRSGRVAAGGIQAPDWTLLQVTDVNQTRLTCELVSGFRSPIPAKGGQRTDRLAFLVRPAWPETRLVLISRTQPGRPLGGYEVLRRTEGESQPQLIGTTDNDGVLRLPATDGRMQPLLVRSGGQLLARLPLVPGQAPELTAKVVDDDGRLRAEGFVLAFQSRVMDLVARRELLAAQFRQRLSAGKLDEAQNVLEEYRQLESRADLMRVLDQQQQEITSSDRLTKQRIDRLFSDARKLLLKFLDPNTANDLARELASARTQPPAASPASATSNASAPLAAPSQP